MSTTNTAPIEIGYTVTFRKSPKARKDTWTRYGVTAEQVERETREELAEAYENPVLISVAPPMDYDAPVEPDTYTTILHIGNLTACATVEAGALVSLESGGVPVSNVEAWFEAEALLSRPGDEAVAEFEDDEAWAPARCADCGSEHICAPDGRVRCVICASTRVTRAAA